MKQTPTTETRRAFLVRYESQSEDFDEDDRFLGHTVVKEDCVVFAKDERDLEEHLADMAPDLMGEVLGELPENYTRACNAHEELVAALKGMLAICPNSPTSADEAPRHWPETARAALAKAEGK